MALLPVPKNGRDIGECIYCGSADGPLQREHAVPYGLNGTWTLLRASCGACALLTHRFERDTLKGLWPAIRSVLSMQTRRKTRLAALPLVIEVAGSQKTIEVEREQFPLYLPTPIFPAPGYITGLSSVNESTPQLQFRHVAGPSFQEIARQHSAEFVGARLTFSPQEFARTLAKIAFCAGVYTLGLLPLRSSPLRKVIRGTDRNWGHWVGQWNGEEVNPAKGLHAMQVRASGCDVHVILRLFAQFGAPEYHIVLGSADPDFVKSDKWPWKD